MIITPFLIELSLLQVYVQLTSKIIEVSFAV